MMFRSVNLLSVCALFCFSCSKDTPQRHFLAGCPAANDERVYQLEYRGDDDLKMRSPLAVVDFTGAIEIPKLERRGSGFYAKVRTAQWYTELVWSERPLCLLVDPEMNLFVNELPLSKNEESAKQLFSVFGGLLSSDPREVDSHKIYQHWRGSLGNPALGSCRVLLYQCKGTSRSTTRSGNTSGFSMFFYGNYGGSVGGPGVDVPCKYFDSVYQNGERWAVLNSPDMAFRFRWKSGILLLDVSDRGDLLGMIIDTEGQNMSFEDAAKAGLLDNKEPIYPLRKVEGLDVDELRGEPLIFLR